MADLPILFSSPMVRAILREIEQPGTGKTQTRRVLDAWCDDPPAFVDNGVVTACDQNDQPYRWPRSNAVGDRLYVREAQYLTDDGDYERVVYAAEDADVAEHLAIISRLEGSHPTVNWSRHRRRRPPMHMPRWASRITLIVTDVRVQRLQEISEADAIAEGVERLHQGYYPYGIATFMTTFVGDREVPAQYCPTAVGSFQMLWNSLNDSRGLGWDANPWIAAYTFQPILGNIDQIGGA